MWLSNTILSIKCIDRSTYVWLDIFSIPQFHDGRELLVVKFLLCLRSRGGRLHHYCTSFDVSTGDIAYGKDLRVAGHLLDFTISRRL